LRNMKFSNALFLAIPLLARAAPVADGLVVEASPKPDLLACAGFWSITPYPVANCASSQGGWSGSSNTGCTNFGIAAQSWLLTIEGSCWVRVFENEGCSGPQIFWTAGPPKCENAASHGGLTARSFQVERC
jgi:hypothetical protein